VPRGGRRIEQHEKSMGSYELFAWRDAMEIASYLDEEYGAPKARRIYEGLRTDVVVEFESKYSELLREFIQKSVSQRPGYLRKITKDVSDEYRIMFLVLAILGVVRAKDVIELRDQYRSVMAPGRGNRVTTAAFYALSNDIKGTIQYDWPWEVFDAFGCSDEEDEEEYE